MNNRKMHSSRISMDEEFFFRLVESKITKQKEKAKHAE
jgi:hypothetical protein